MDTAKIGFIATFASLAIQRIVEAFDEPLGWVSAKTLTKGASEAACKTRKKSFATWASILLGLVAAGMADLHLLAEAGIGGGGGPIDMLLSGLILGSGSEGVNSIL